MIDVWKPLRFQENWVLINDEVTKTNGLTNRSLGLLTEFIHRPAFRQVNQTVDFVAVFQSTVFVTATDTCQQTVELATRGLARKLAERVFNICLTNYQ
jgi:hypothetical protein